MAVTHTDTQPTLSVTVAARIRAALALRGMNQADLARSMRVPAAWLSRRLSPHAARPVSLNLDEIEHIAELLEITVPALFGIGELTWPREDRARRPRGGTETYGFRPTHLRLVS